MITPAEHLSATPAALQAAGAARGGDVGGGAAGKRRAASRLVYLDRALEALPLFRLSDSNEEGAIAYTAASGGRWRVLPAPGDRLPGTFDQDVYIELLYRYQESGRPSDGVLTFTLHAFLRAMARRVDGRTYEQLRGALARLERTTLESTGGYWDAANNKPLDGAFTLLSAATVDRRRAADRDQLSLFPSVTAAEPGVARVTLAPQLRSNLTQVTSRRCALVDIRRCFRPSRDASIASSPFSLPRVLTDAGACRSTRSPNCFHSRSAIPVTSCAS